MTVIRDGLFNADDFDMLQYGVGNLFAYCDNNPVNFIDHTGNYSVNNALSYAKKVVEW